MEIIKPSILSNIEKRYENIELKTGQYIYDEDNINTNFILGKFMDCDPKSGKTLNISSGIFKSVADSYKNGVGNPKTDEIFDTVDWWKVTDDYTANGMIILELTSDGVYYVPSDEFHIVEDSAGDILTRFRYIKTAENGKDSYYLFKKEYKAGFNYNYLYKVQSDTALTGTKVELSSISDTAGFQDVETTGLSVPSIFYVEDDSTYDSIKSLVYAIERKMVAIDNEMIQFIKTRMLAKNLSIKAEDMDNEIWFSNSSDSSIDIIKKENPHVALALNVIERQIEQISSITQVPTDDLGIQRTSSVGADAQTIRRSSYVKKIQYIRTLIEDVIWSIWEANSKEYTILWDSILEVDKLKTLDIIEKGKAQRVISELESIKMFWDVSDEKALLILNTINNENPTITNQDTENRDNQNVV